VTPPERSSLPASVAEVIGRMRVTVGTLPRADGVRCFVQLYLAVTEGVQSRLAGLTFADPKFLARLDVVFANRFFAALDVLHDDPAQLPRAWAPLIEFRSQHGIAPLQFALAGMNAHINRDLPEALVATCQDLDIPLVQGSPQHADFVRVNRVLAAVESTVKQQYLTGWLRTVDRLVHRVDRLDDVVAMWNVARARDAAWTNGEALWVLRDNRELFAEYLIALDRSVGFAGRGLLIPADTLLQRLARRFSGVLR
jgi:hypothetical protein